MWRGRCWYPLPTAVTYTHSCTANCLLSNELTELPVSLHMLGFAWCISASLLFVLKKSFSVPAVIFRNWQVGFCKWIKFILNMDIALHQKTMKRQEICSRTYPSLCGSWFLSARRNFKWGRRENSKKKVSKNYFLVASPVLCARG